MAEFNLIVPSLLLDYRSVTLYQEWLNLGNEGTMADFIAWLRTPATEAAAQALQAAAEALAAAQTLEQGIAAAEAAATLANTKAGLANDAAVLATDKAILAQSAADNANAKAAEVTAAVLSAGYLGTINPTDAAPTPAKSGKYEFSIGGNKPAWLTAEAGITTVKAGDGVAVVYDGVSSYIYTHIDISSHFTEITKTYASSYGFLPTSTGLENKIALQAALDEGGHIFVSVPGIYEIDNTVFIGDNTTLEFCPGCTLKKVATGASNYFSQIFCSKSVKDATMSSRNKNIKIIGNGLNLNINGQDNKGGMTYKYMLAEICLFQVDNFEVSGLTVDDLTPAYQQYFFEMLNCNDGYVHEIDLKNYSKDGIDIVCSKRIHIKNYKSNTGDDAIFIGYGWLEFTPLLGDTEDILIENWERYHSSIAAGNSALIATASWDEWMSGRQYGGGVGDAAESCSYLGNVYRKVTTGTQTASVAPTHTYGEVTGADGINWRFIAASSEKSANVRRVTFKNCSGFADRDFIRGSYQDKTVQANVNQAIISNLVFDSCKWLPYPSIANTFNYFIDRGANYDVIKFIDCDININNYVNSNTCTFFKSLHSVTHTNYLIDNLIIESCKIDSSNNGFPPVNMYGSNSIANNLTIKDSAILQKVVSGNGLIMLFNSYQFSNIQILNCKIDKMERLVYHFNQLGLIAPTVIHSVNIANNVFTACKYIYALRGGEFGGVRITGSNNKCTLTDALFSSDYAGSRNLTIDSWRGSNIGYSQLNAGLASKYQFNFIEFNDGRMMINNKLIEYGANDSGGTGYKILRVLN